MRKQTTATERPVSSPDGQQGPDDARSRGEIAVLHKALDVLERLAGDDGLTVAEICEGTPITKAAAYRVLNTLEARGYVLRDSDDHEVRRYSLGPAAEALGGVMQSSAGIVDAARPAMETLWQEFGETVNLGVLSRGQVLYLDILESDQGLRTSVQVGSRDGPHSTALGKAMLACLPVSEARRIFSETNRIRMTPNTVVAIPSLLRQLDECRTRGFSLDDEENEPGARCVASAIVDRRGRPLGAISVSAPAWRMPDDTVERIGARLREICADLGRVVG